MNDTERSAGTDQPGGTRELMYRQIFDGVDVGIIILDREHRVLDWNHWLEARSTIKKNDAIGRDLLELFPNLDNPVFRRSCRSVFTFGNFAYFAQKIHSYLIPIETRSPTGAGFTHMQQNCTLGPVRSGKVDYAYLMIQDVTDIAAYEKRLSELANTDGLTGAYNRSYLNRIVESEISRHKRHDRRLSVVMFDLDRFKDVNDAHGHLAGDEVLRVVMRTVLNRVRTSDTVARYGGEEFCVLLPETAVADAVIFSEQIRSLIEQTTVHHRGTEIRITASFGVAELSSELNTAEALFRQADIAMYEAKRNGRNQVCTAGSVNH